MTSKKTIISVFIILLGIAIGFLGELMLDETKNDFQNFCCQYLHAEPTTVWWCLVVLTIILFVWLSLKQEQIQEETPPPNIEIKDSKNINTAPVNTGGGDFRLGDN